MGSHVEHPDKAKEINLELDIANRNATFYGFYDPTNFDDMEEKELNLDEEKDCKWLVEKIKEYNLWIVRKDKEND